MRTTIRLDDDLEGELRSRAAAEGLTFGGLVNRLLRQAVKAKRQHRPSAPRHRERPAHLGEPLMEVTKALELAAQLEDEETVRKIHLRK